jgi:beta-glucuronidase
MKKENRIFEHLFASETRWKTISFVIALLSLNCMVMNAQTFPSSDPKDIALYPQQNEFRNKLDLSGVWKFRKDSTSVGEQQAWQKGLTDCTSIAVPGSWNEQIEGLSNYLGKVWYETSTYVPQNWKDERVFLRIGSAVYAAKIWINGEALGQHLGGNVPFAFDITPMVNWGKSNRITILVENELKPDRVPPGNVSKSAYKAFPNTTYDFFPYAGLNRAVLLYSVPKTAAIKDVTLNTDFHETTGVIHVAVEKSGNVTSGNVTVSGGSVSVNKSFSFRKDMAHVDVEIPNVQLWSPEHPFLYQVTVEIGNKHKPVDAYSCNTGVRTIKVTDKQILLNGKTVYMKGFGRHVDFPIFGRGTALPVMIKDFSLMKWIGANSFRTSHYPYDEEFYDMADREGFLLIDEIPAVGLNFYDGDENIAARKAACQQYIHEMINRDKNHPSIIVWSVANEPEPSNLSSGFSSISQKLDQAENDRAKEFLGGLIDMAKSLDKTRPVVFVGGMGMPAEWFEKCDILCINRYFGWYTHVGDLNTGLSYFSREMDMLHKTYNRPVIVTEFGAEADAGNHSQSEEIFSEEFQNHLIQSYLDVADSKDFVAGMHIWNFADFKTAQTITRPNGFNMKGVFTRDRQPKLSARMLQQRWNNTSDNKHF